VAFSTNQFLVTTQETLAHQGSASHTSEGKKNCALDADLPSHPETTGAMDATQISTKKRKRKHSSRDADNDGAKDKEIRKKERLERKKKKEKKVQGEDEGELEEVQKADEEGSEKEVKALSSGKPETSGGGGGGRSSKSDGEEEENNKADEDDTLERPDADTNTGSGDIPLSSSLSLPIVGESPVKFTDLNLSDATQKAIAAMGFEKMTDVQSRTIPPLMAGRDV